jgi:putative membrane protein insertion efficiency factor
MRPVIGRVIPALRVGVTAVLLAPVHLWRATVVMRQPRCRYYPSCSTYAVGALRVHGPVRGSALAAGRLLRCHPWSPGGIDHVPPRRTEPLGRARAGSPGTALQSPATPFGVRDA